MVKCRHDPDVCAESRADDTDWAWAPGSIWLAFLISFRQQAVVTNSAMIRRARVEKQHPTIRLINNVQI